MLHILGKRPAVSRDGHGELVDVLAVLPPLLDQSHHTGLRNTSVVSYFIIGSECSGVVRETAEPQVDTECDVVLLVVVPEVESLEFVLQLLEAWRLDWFAMERGVLGQVLVLHGVVQLLLAQEVLVLLQVEFSDALAALQLLVFLLPPVSSLTFLDQFVDYIRNGQLLEPFGATEWSLEVQRGYTAGGSLPLLRVKELWRFCVLEVV